MRFRVLGHLEVQGPDGWTAISAAKWRSLLACLLVRPGQLVPTESLIDELWGENPPSTANNMVSIYVHRLRKEVIGDAEGEVLVHRAPGYVLRVAPGDVDIQVFESLLAEGRSELAADRPGRAAELFGEALGLWRGPLLADVPRSPALVTAAARATELWLDATELRIEADIACDRAAQVVAELRGLVADHPMRERLWALLMRALDEAGRRAEAFETYAQARRRIADELGVEPGSELQRLYAELLAADATSASTPTPPKSATGRLRGTPAPHSIGQADAASPDMTGADGIRTATPTVGAPGALGQRIAARPDDVYADGADWSRVDSSGSIAIGTIADPGSPGAAAPAAPEAPDPAPGSGPVIPRPAQLPTDIGDFTGRETPVEQLCALLLGADPTSSPGAVPIAVVNGAGGLGKTTLAVHAAHQVRAQFPDGQLYVDLLGASAEPAQPGEVLARFLRDLGLPGDQVPAHDDERAALYRTRLTGRRVLILLDNARDAAQVRQLLPGSSSCAVLVTTRNRTPDLVSTRFVDLNVLEDAEALALFAQIVGEDRAAAEPDATAEVLVACAGLPLAIRICAARVAARRSWPIAALAARLRNEHRRLDELSMGDLAVRASFQVSYDSLRSPLGGVSPVQVFCLLGLWQEPWITLADATALVGAPENDTADALEILVDANLLESPAPDCYRLHALLRVYATERATAELSAQERYAAITRLRDWQDREQASTSVGLPQFRAGCPDGAEADGPISAAGGLDGPLAQSGTLLLEAEPEITAAPTPPSRRSDRDPGAGLPPDSELPARGQRRETPDHSHGGDLGAANRTARAAVEKMSAQVGPDKPTAASEPRGDDLPDDSAPTANDETLLAALRTLLTSHGIVEPEQVAACSAALIVSWPKMPAPPETAREADGHPVSAPVSVIPDALGHDLRPDPLIGTTIADFVTALNQLRQWAGNPPYREMERRCGRAVKYATICTALTGDELPSLRTVVAIVAACGGGDEEESAFSTAWRKLEIRQGPRRRKGKNQPVGRRLYSVPDTA